MNIIDNDNERKPPAEATAVKAPRGAARPSRQARKSTGWLKTLLATSGVALTIIGSGLIAQRDASSGVVAPDGATTSTLTLTLDPVPTAAAPSAATGTALDAGSHRTARLVFPGAMTLSRSSR